MSARPAAVTLIAGCSVLQFFLLAAAPLTSQAAGAIKYDVLIDLTVHYDSTSVLRDSGAGCTGNTTETDDFRIRTVYGFPLALAIPRSGAPTSTYDLTAFDVLVTPVPGKPMYSAKSATTLECTHGTVGYTDCTGNLRSEHDDLPHLLSRNGMMTADLPLRIETARTIRVEDAKGQHLPLGCADTYDNQHAFDPAWGLSMPDMLAVNVDLPLAALRKLSKPNQRYTLSVSSDKNIAGRPPIDCSSIIATCSQTVHWSGSVSFEREK